MVVSNGPAMQPYGQQTQDQSLAILGKTGSPPPEHKQTFFDELYFVVHYLFAELKRRPLSFILAIFTVFLTVGVIALLTSAVSQSGLIFFRMSEINVGEQDLILTPGAGVRGSSHGFAGETRTTLLNQTTTDVASFGGGTPYDSSTYFTPRSNISAGVSARFFMFGATQAPLLIFNDREEYINQDVVASGIIAGIDSPRERLLGVGRNWIASKAPVPDDGIYISRTIIRQLGVDDDVIDAITSQARDRWSYYQRTWSLDDNNRYYKKRDATTRAWSAEGVLPVLTVMLRLDITQLLATVFDETLDNSDGQGTESSPYIITPLPSSLVLTLLETINVIPPPQGCTTWGSCWETEIRMTGLTEQLNISDIVKPQELINRIVAQAMQRPLNDPLRTFLQLWQGDTLQIPLSALNDLWYQLSPQDGADINITLGTQYYLFNNGNKGIPSPFPDTKGDPDVVVPTIELIIKRTNSILESPEFDVDEDAFNTSAREAIRYRAAPATWPIDQPAPYQGGLVKDYMIPLASVLIGLMKYTKELIVSDVFGSPEGKIAETMGGITLCEVEPLFSMIKIPIINLMSETLVVDVPGGSMDLGPIIDNMNILPPGTSAGSIPVSWDEQFYNITFPEIISRVGNLTPEQSQEVVDSITKMIQDAYGRDYTPMIIAQMGPGGTNDIAQGYHDMALELGLPDPTGGILTHIYHTLETIGNIPTTLYTGFQRIFNTFALHHVLLHNPETVMNFDDVVKYNEMKANINNNNNTDNDSENTTNNDNNNDEFDIQSQHLIPHYDKNRLQPSIVTTQVKDISAQSRAPNPLVPEKTLHARQKYRLKAYDCNSNCQRQNLADFSNDLFLALGDRYPATVNAALFTALDSSEFMSAFLNSLFGAIIALIIALSAILTYSLFLLDVQTKNYEYGMLRAMGFKQRGLVILLVLKTLFISIIGISLGLFLAWACWFPVRGIIADKASTDQIGPLTNSAIILSIVFGLLVPLISNTLPISHAMSQTLRNALTLYHSTLSDVTVTIKQLNAGIDLWQSCIAIMLIVFGFITFYLIPMAFINNNFSMFLSLLMLILCAMLLGFAILAQIAQPFLQVGVLAVLACWTRPLRGIIRRSMGAHNSSNMKVSLMLTITIAFVVFAGVVFALMSQSLQSSAKLLLGAPIVVTSSGTSLPLPEEALNEYLDDLESITDTNHPFYGVVHAHAYISFKIQNAEYDLYRPRLSPISLYPSSSETFYALQPQFLEASYTYLYHETEANINNNPDGFTRVSTGLEAIFRDAGRAVLPFEMNSDKPPMISLISGGVNSAGSTYTDRSENDFATVRNDIMKEAYTRYNDLIINEALRPGLSLNTEIPAVLTLGTRDTPTQQKTDSQEGKTNPITTTSIYPGTSFAYLAKARAMSDRCPGFFMSKFASLKDAGAILTSEEQVLYMIKNVVEAKQTARSVPLSLPKQRLFVNVPSHVSSSLREDIVAGIRSRLPSDRIVVTDTESVVSAMSDSVDLLNTLFIIISVIAMILCFIMMSVAITTNVHTNAWENGVLRAIGLTKVQVLLVYILESYAIGISCLISGTIIGIVVAISLALLFDMLTGIGISLQFPYSTYFSLVAMIVVVCFFAAFVPAYRFARQPISKTLRRT